MLCDFCKKDRWTDKLYDLRGWKVCWDCYWKDVDKKQRKNQEVKG